MDRNDGEVYCGKTSRKLVIMRTTYPEAKFEFIDTTAAEDSTIVWDTCNPISELELLCQTEISVPEYATLERNCFILDGSREIMDEIPNDVPFFSSQTSDDNCVISQSITIEFSKEHSSVGFTLTFAEQYMTSIRITCFGQDQTKILSKTFTPNCSVYYCDMNVQRYCKVVIDFMNTKLPGQYIKLNNILFGREWLLSRDRIKTASLYEEVDATSATLSINTAKVEIIDKEGDFNLKNQNGLWKALQREQAICVVEHIDNSVVDCGMFYLNDWISKDNVVSLSFVDLLGVMDKTTFYEGEIYQDIEAGQIVEKIMNSFGSDSYEIEEEVATIKLNGYLGIQSHRAALQQVAFACGAVVDCSRGDKIRIFKHDKYVKRFIGIDRKFQGTTVKLDDYISSVSISYKTYSLDDAGSEVFKGMLNQGENRIEFTSPCLPESMIPSNGMIKEAKTNYIVLNMDKSGECIITGKKYNSVENTVKASVDQIEVGEVKKDKSYSGCTLMDSIRAKNVADFILDFYQMRQIVTMKFVNDGECAGDWCDVYDRNNGIAVTSIVKQEINLSGGNIAQVTCRGYSKVVTDLAYIGEIYAGERSLI